MARTPKYKVEDICQALNETKGLVYLAAKRLGCCPQTIYSARDKYDKVRECLVNERGMFVDTAELALHSAVIEKQPWAVALVLKTLGKDRGYVEKSELEVSGGKGLSSLLHEGE